MISLIELLKNILFEEKKKADRCLRIARRKNPKSSAYRSGSIERCRQGDIWKGLKENDELEKYGIKFFNYIPYSFPPDLNSLSKEEHEVVVNDLQIFKDNRQERTSLVGYLKFANSMSDINPIYKSILLKLIKSNKDKLDFTLDQNKIFDYEGPVKLQKFKEFYEKYKDRFPNWASTNEKLYIDTVNALKSSLNEAQKETLRTWFKRKGAPGKEGGWVDCNTCRNGKCKACGRKKGEKRAKYPSCRPTLTQCKTPGKGKKWGKTK
jgi:hypothetical protein